MLSQHEFFSANSSRAVVAYILASKSSQPNAYGAKIPVSSQLNISVWRHYLIDYVEKSREPGPSRQVCGLRLTFVRLDHAPQGFLHPKTSQSQV